MSKEIEIGENFTILLIVLVVGIFAVFYFYFDSKNPEPKATTEQTMIITKTNVDGVETVDTTYIN